MIKSKYISSAPGNIRLMGEYAVLEGHPAISCAINKRMLAILTPRSDKFINIRTILGEYQLSVNNIEINKDLVFLTSILKFFEKDFDNGFDIEIKSDFDSSIGLGSSASLVVSVIGVISQWLGLNLSNKQILEIGIKIVRQVQGSGSGLDIATAIYGGIVYFYPQKNIIKRIEFFPDITLIYSGYKTPTAKAINLVKEKFIDKELLKDKILSSIACSVDIFVDNLNKKNINELGNLFSINYGFQQSLGISDQNINDIISLLNKCGGIYGAKIAGAGFGDCIVAIGKISTTEKEKFYHLNDKIKFIDIKISDAGLKYE